MSTDTPKRFRFTLTIEGDTLGALDRTFRRFAMALMMGHYGMRSPSPLFDDAECRLEHDLEVVSIDTTH